MITYKDTIYDYITKWMRSLILSSNKQNIICIITGGTDSCLNAALCLRSTSNIPTDLIFMGFKQEQENAFEKWVKDNFQQNHYNIIKPDHPVIKDDTLENVNTAVSMIPAYLDIYAKLHNAISFGNITKSEYSLVKFFKSRVDDCYDYYPLIDLYKSECKEIAIHMGLPDKVVDSKSITEESFGFTFDELEWLDRENDNISIVSGTDFPITSKFWGMYNDRKKLLLTRVFQLNKQNINKTIQDNKKCLVRKAFPGAIS